MNLLRLCDMHNIPVATNIATAEVLIHGLERGDLDGAISCGIELFPLQDGKSGYNRTRPAMTRDEYLRMPGRETGAPLGRCEAPLGNEEGKDARQPQTY